MSLSIRRLGRISYEAALAIQEELVRRKVGGDPEDYLLLLEHDPVYTLGRGADAGDLREADRVLGVPTFRVGRGGGVTFHGPGQFVAYPVISLPRGDVHGYVRSLEEILVGVCADFDIVAASPDDQTGVWTPHGKIASIGIGVRRRVTCHGVALNVSTDLSYFERIVPCRMPGLPMTSMERELGCAPPMAAVENSFVRRFGGRYDTAGEAVESRP